MSSEKRLTQLNRAARAVALIERWHQVSESLDVWGALVNEARRELRPRPDAPVNAALIDALTAMIAEIAEIQAAGSAQTTKNRRAGAVRSGVVGVRND